LGALMGDTEALRLGDSLLKGEEILFCRRLIACNEGFDERLLRRAVFLHDTVQLLEARFCLRSRDGGHHPYCCENADPGHETPHNSSRDFASSNTETGARLFYFRAAR